MWNGNNPVEWSDPTGYCPSDPESAQNDPCLPSGLGREHGQRMTEATNTLEAIGKFALSLAIPGGGEIDGAEALLTVGIRALTTHAAERIAGRGITAEMAAKAISAGTRLVDTETNNVVHVLEKGGPGGQTLIVFTSRDGKTLNSVLSTSSKTYVSGKIKNAIWVQRP